MKYTYPTGTGADLRPDGETPFGRDAPVTLQDLLDNQGFSPQERWPTGKNPPHPRLTMGSPRGNLGDAADQEDPTPKGDPDERA